MNATDLETIRAFYVGNRQQLYTYALSLTGHREAAEDAIHGVFERLLRGRGLPADLRPYAFRAIRNAAFDTWRRAQVRRDSIFEPADDSAAGASGEDWEPLLQRLAPDERESVVLRIFGGLTFQEIADLRGAPLPTVASWYRRGIEHLRTMLETEH